MVSTLYFLSMGLFALGVGGSLFFKGYENGRNYIAHSASAGGSLAAALCAIFVFLEGETSIPLWQWEWLGIVEARLDYLSAWFLLLTGILGIAASVYAVAYCREYYGHRLGLLTSCFNAFLLSLTAVFTVSHVVAFLLAWEAMTLVSFFLVNIDWEESANRRAGYVYLVMAQIGTAFLMAAFFILSSSVGSCEFSKMAAAPLSPDMQVVVFLLAFIGFATKAGLIPVHIWLPEAHPAAPSHVSALMSGVMIKSAVYGFSRFALEFLSAIPLWCGAIVLVTGVITCLLAVLYALMENNLKRMLAYSSIENMGIIFLAFGAGLMLMASGHSSLAGLAWIAGWFHAFNHGLFKGLLFLGAGAVIQATGYKDIEKMGGLIKIMPLTATLFAIASVALSALPPSNGFVSEWFVFQALFAIQQTIPGITGKLATALLMAALGMTGALAAACFVKAFGMIFLAKPRSAKTEQASESSPLMLLPMAMLALLCIGIGIYPASVIQMAASVAASFTTLSAKGINIHSWSGITIDITYQPITLLLPVALGLFVFSILLSLILVRLGGVRNTTVGETWTCGIVPDARMEYTATGFSKPVRVAFGGILGFRRSKIIEYMGNMYYGRRIEYDVTIHHLVNERIYHPVNDKIIAWSKWIRRLQNGSLRLYIGYILVVMIVALFWSAR